MPFEIAALGDVLFALLAMAIGYAIITFGKFLANLIPNLPLIGSFLRDGVIRLTFDAGAWLMGAAHSSFARIQHLIADTHWLIVSPIAALISALDHHASQISTLHNVDIPAARDSAVATAHGYTDSVHAAIASALTVEHDNRISSQTHLANDIRAVEHWIDTTVTSGIRSDISTAVGNAERAITATLDTFEQHVEDQMTNVWADIHALQTSVSETIPKDIAAVAANAAKAVAAAEQQDIATLRQTAAALQTAIASGVAGAEHYAHNLAANLQGNLDRRLHTVQVALTGNIRADIGAVNGKLDALIGKQSIDQSQINGLDTAVTVAIPATIGALATQIATITSEVDNCMVTQCAGPNNIENVIERLLGGLSTLAEIGYIAAAVKDPTGTAAGTAPYLDGIDSLANGALNALLSL